MLFLFRLFHFFFARRLRHQWRKERDQRLYFAQVCYPAHVGSHKPQMYWRWWFLDYQLIKANSEARL